MANGGCGKRTLRRVQVFLLCCIVCAGIIGTVSAFSVVNNQAGVMQKITTSSVVVVARALDSDKDGVADAGDNCPRASNQDQADSDGDGFGNACDNCWNVANRDQKDTGVLCMDAIRDPKYFDAIKNAWIKDPACGDACRSQIKRVAVNPGITGVVVAKPVTLVEVAKIKEVSGEMENRGLKGDDPNRTIIDHSGFAPVNPNVTVRTDVVIAKFKPAEGGVLPAGNLAGDSEAAGGEAEPVPAVRRGFVESIVGAFIPSAEETRLPGGSSSPMAKRGFLESLFSIFSPPAEEKQRCSAGCSAGYYCDRPTDTCQRGYIRATLFGSSNNKWGDTIKFTGSVTPNFHGVVLKLHGQDIPVGGIVIASVTSQSDGTWTYLWDTGQPLSSGYQKKTGSYIVWAYSEDSSQSMKTAPLNFESLSNGCGAGISQCGGTCHDIRTDFENCGVCGNTCSDRMSCVNGECRCPVNAAGKQEMNCHGSCVDIGTDSRNCNYCDIWCGYREVCQDARCVLASAQPPGRFKDCDRNPSNGPETDTSTDPAHCGSCNEICPSGNVCEKGWCTPPCPASVGYNHYTHCSEDGVCVNLGNDPRNCGNCGIECLAGASCCNGKCVKTETDKTNCGQCFRSCKVSEKCQNGQCV